MAFHFKQAGGQSAASAITDEPTRGDTEKPCPTTLRHCNETAFRAGLRPTDSTVFPGPANAPSRGAKEAAAS